MEQQPGAQPPQQTRFSEDGRWFWDGQQWRSALSEDGRWRWDGQQWQPVEQQAQQQPAAGGWAGEAAAGASPTDATASYGGGAQGGQYGPGEGQGTAYSAPQPSGDAAQAQTLGAGISGSGPTSSPQVNFDHSLVTTAFHIDGMRVTRNLGVVRGIIVRSRSVVGSIGAGIQQVFGGNISIFTELCEQSRRDAYELMIQHAAQLGANAVIGMRYDATELTQGVTEVLAYGTAVVMEPGG